MLLSISFKVKLMVAQISVLLIHCVKYFILPTWAIKITPYSFVQAILPSKYLMNQSSCRYCRNYVGKAHRLICESSPQVMPGVVFPHASKSLLGRNHAHFSLCHQDLGYCKKWPTDNKLNQQQKPKLLSFSQPKNWDL